MNSHPFLADMIVAEVLATWPQTIPVFLRLNMACVGCGMAAFDTLRDVSMNYEIPIEALLGELAASLRGKEEIVP